MDGVAAGGRGAATHHDVTARCIASALKGTEVRLDKLHHSLAFNMPALLQMIASPEPFRRERERPGGIQDDSQGRLRV